MTKPKRGINTGQPFEDWFAEYTAPRGKPVTAREKGIALLAFEAGYRSGPPKGPPVSWWRYAAHNVLGHPAMWALGVLGLRGAAGWVHEHTLPRAVRGRPMRQALEAGELFRQ